MSHASLAVTIPVAVILLLLAIPAGMTALLGWTRRLDRKGRLGVHTSAARETDAAFELANRVAAPLVAGAAVVGAVCAVLVLALPVGTVGAVIIAAIGLVGILAQFRAGTNLAEQAARTVPRRARKPEGGGCCGSCDCGGDGCGAQDSGTISGPANGVMGGSSVDEIPDLVPDATTR